MKIYCVNKKKITHSLNRMHLALSAALMLTRAKIAFEDPNLIVPSFTAIFLTAPCSLLVRSLAPNFACHEDSKLVDAILANVHDADYLTIAALIGRLVSLSRRCLCTFMGRAASLEDFVGLSS